MLFKKKLNIKRIAYTADNRFNLFLWKDYNGYIRKKHRIIIRTVQFSPNIIANLLWINISNIGNFPLIFESKKTLLEFRKHMSGRDDWDIDWDLYMNSPNTSIKNVKEYKSYFYDVYFVSKTKISFIDMFRRK